MTIQSAIPYLILNGKAQSALAFYQRALDAKVETVRRFGEVDQSCPEAMREQVMHAELRLGSAVIMLSDGGPNSAQAGPGAVSVALNLDDLAQARRCFEALAVGGRVVQPLIDAPWGAVFGAVNDEFGISWMFNCTK